jgi:hypothetical protein
MKFKDVYLSDLINSKLETKTRLDITGSREKSNFCIKLVRTYIYTDIDASIDVIYNSGLDMFNVEANLLNITNRGDVMDWEELERFFYSYYNISTVLKSDIELLEQKKGAEAVKSFVQMGTYDISDLLYLLMD